MRQNVTICLLSVCATLLAVNLLVNLRTEVPVALGQATDSGGGYVIATGMNQSGNEAVCYIFNTASRKLAVYTTRNQGVEFRGIRDLSYDLQLVEFNPRGQRVTVEQIKEVLKKLNK